MSKRRRLSPSLDIDAMSIPEIIKEHLDEIKPKSLLKKCLNDLNGKYISLWVMYRITKEEPITDQLPHYMFISAVQYLSTRNQSFVDADLSPLWERTIQTLDTLCVSTIHNIDGERKEFNERMQAVRPPTKSPSIKIHIARARQAKAIIDSGAEACVMSLNVAKQCKILARIDCRHRCTSCGVNGTSVSYGKIFSLDIKIRDTVSSKMRTFYIDVDILDTADNHMILLGQTFFQQYGCVLTTRRPEDPAQGVHKVTFAVSSDSPTTRNGPSCTPEIL